MTRIIDAHRERFGVEPICRELQVAPSTYYAARCRKPSARRVRDEALKLRLRQVHDEHFEAYGARKMWRQLRREDVPVARCTVERLMRELRLSGGVLAWECSVLHEGRWIFALITDLPGFSNISEQEARRFYHHIGGQLPHVSHMSADPIEMMVVAGRPGTIAKQMAVVGGVPRYDYALVGAPAWARVSSTGYFSVIDVPVSAPPDGLSFFVRVTDSNGLSMLVPVRVDIIN